MKMILRTHLDQSQSLSWKYLPNNDFGGGFYNGFFEPFEKSVWSSIFLSISSHFSLIFTLDSYTSFNLIDEHCSECF